MANYKRWTDAEREYIRSNHKTLCDEELAKVLSQMTGEVITTSMVRRQRRHLSLKKGSRATSEGKETGQFS